MSKKREVEKTPEEWKKALSPTQYAVLREKGTERAFTGELWDHHEDGKYLCAACGAELFESESKFDSGCGWPSFTLPVEEARIDEETDTSYGMKRTEVMCSRCGGHLGHVFDDGPKRNEKEKGLRYCINSASLKFEKK